MITRRFVLTGFVATAGVATASQYISVEVAKPYATVYGVGWDLEVVEYHVWTPQDALSFAKFGRGTGIDLFREVTEVVYNVPIEPLPHPRRGLRQDTLADQMKRFSKPIEIQENGFTNIVYSRAIWDWQNSLRPDVAREYGDWSGEWAKEQLAGERDYEANSARYIEEARKTT